MRIQPDTKLGVKTLRRVWEEQYTIVKGKPEWRKIKAMSLPATLTASPYDPEARYTTKRSSSWVGYKVHLTETCDDDTPNLITHVLTTSATTPDDNQVAVIHSALAKQRRLPAEHLVDKGYTDAQEFVSSKHDYGVTLVGPVSNDPSWQARAGEGYDKSQFHFDWEQQVATCPSVKQSLSWLKSTYPQNGTVWEARF